MIKAYKFRAYPNKEQQLLFAKTFGCARFVYNYYLYKKIGNYSEPPSKSTKIHRVRPYGKLSLAIILWIVMNYCLIWG